MSESSVTLHWEIPYSAKGRRTAELFIKTLGKLDRKSLPRRYGLHEPLRGLVENDDYSFFFQDYLKAGAAPFGGSLHFTTRWRFSGGSFAFSDPRDPVPRARAVGLKRVRLHFDLLGRDVETPEGADRLEKIFVAVARVLGAFYGIAYLQSGLERRGSRLYSYTMYPLPRSTYWLGVPPVPGWMVWHGPPYAKALRTSCEDHITAEFDEGFLMRRGRLPVGLDALREDQPIYPPELTANLCEQTLSGKIHSIFPPDVTALDPRTYDKPAAILLPLD